MLVLINSDNQDEADAGLDLSQQLQERFVDGGATFGIISYQRNATPPSQSLSPSFLYLFSSRLWIGANIWYQRRFHPGRFISVPSRRLRSTVVTGMDVIMQ